MPLVKHHGEDWDDDNDYDDYNTPNTSRANEATFATPGSRDKQSTSNLRLRQSKTR